MKHKRKGNYHAMLDNKIKQHKVAWWKMVRLINSDSVIIFKVAWTTTNLNTFYPAH